jgi:dual specificity protein kinase YAK1
MIDMWSFGCILAELYIGAPLFPGDNEFEQINYLVGTLGLPPTQLLKASKRGYKFFNDDLSFTNEIKSAKLTPGFGRPLSEIIEPNDILFREFL